MRKELTGEAETFKQVGEVAYLINDALSRPHITSDQNQVVNGFGKVRYQNYHFVHLMVSLENGICFGINVNPIVIIIQNWQMQTN